MSRLSYLIAGTVSRLMGDGSRWGCNPSLRTKIDAAKTSEPGLTSPPTRKGPILAMHRQRRRVISVAKQEGTEPFVLALILSVFPFAALAAGFSQGTTVSLMAGLTWFFGCVLRAWARVKA